MAEILNKLEGTLEGMLNSILHEYNETEYLSYDEECARTERMLEKCILEVEGYKRHNKNGLSKDCISFMKEISEDMLLDRNFKVDDMSYYLVLLGF